MERIFALLLLSVLLLLNACSASKPEALVVGLVENAPQSSLADTGTDTPETSANEPSKYEIMLQQAITHNQPLEVRHSQGRRTRVAINFVDEDGAPITGLYIRVNTDGREITNEKQENIGSPYINIGAGETNEYASVDENGAYIWYCENYTFDGMHRLSAQMGHPETNRYAPSHHYYLDLTNETASEFIFLWDKNWI